MILVVTLVVAAIAMLAELIYARWAGRRLYGLGDTFTNLSAAAFEHVFTVLVAIPVYQLYQAVYRHRFVDELPFWLALPLALLLLDLGFYLWHRASHRVAILWFGHAVHHSSEEFNFSVASRASGWARLTQRFFYLPMALLGIPVATMVLADAITTLYTLFLHNRFVPKLGVLERILVTPSHHRVHHARNPTYLDKNFAAMFIFWDHLFGTYAEETEPPIFGLTTPLVTHNVGWARFHVLFEIADRVRRARGLRQKLVAPFMPPEWDPEGDHDTHEPAAAPRPLVPRVSGLTRAYALAQHVVLFVAVFGFTFVADHLTLGLRIAAAVWLCASLAIVGALLDARPWAMRLEPVRWVIGLGGLVFGLQLPGG
jgi:sterol desaturase/sphingolipid hydroxylase (fatty acid hydroxylase superfamily)